MLSAHQQVAVRRAFPTARIDGRVIRLGRWIMVYTGEGIDLPTTAGPGGRIVDGCDEAMTLWSELVEVLRGPLMAGLTETRISFSGEHIGQSRA